MFVRVKRCKNKNGSVREYLLLCTAKREGKRVKQITLANLGRAAGIAVPSRVLEIGKNVVGTSEITGEKCQNIGKF